MQHVPTQMFECSSLKTHCKDHEREIWPFTNVAAVTRRLIVYRHLATGRFALKMPGESSYSVSLPVFNSKLNIDYYLDNFNKSQICLDLIRLEFNDSWGGSRKGREETQGKKRGEEGREERKGVRCHEQACSCMNSFSLSNLFEKKAAPVLKFKHSRNLSMSINNTTTIIANDFLAIDCCWL